MDKEAAVFVAGHRGLVGSALTCRLSAEGYRRLLTRTRAELDLLNADDVVRFFAEQRPEYVLLAAARVGGILANSTYPADFIRENLVVQCNVIDAAQRHGVRKLLFLGSSCIYPRLAPQPIQEEHLLSGPLEPTNAPYAIAKIAGLMMCQAYRQQYGLRAVSIMPTNLYGPGDNFGLATGHVMPALICKFHEAKSQRQPTVCVWGSGVPRREFLHVDDLADAALFLMQHYDQGEIINVGAGEDLSVRELAELIREEVGYQGRIVYDTSKPDGMPRKLLDVSRLTALGWRPKIELREGIRQTYQWFLEHLGELRQG